MPTGETGQTPGTLVIADDHPVVRGGLRGFVEARGWRVLGEAEDIPAAVRAVSEHRPEVLLADVHMPGDSVQMLLAAVASASPATRTLMLTVDHSVSVVQAAMAAGAHGYILKDASLPDLIRALEEVRAGRSYLDPRLGAEVLKAARGPLASLSDDEVVLLRLLALGHTAREISEMIDMPQRHVEWMRTSVQRSLGVDTRAGLTRIAIQTGLIGPSTLY